MWWLGRAEAAARKAGEGYGSDTDPVPAINEKIREHATGAGEFDPAEVHHGKHADSEPLFVLAILPLGVVIVLNFLLSLVVLPRLDFAFLAEKAWGGTTIGAVAGIWSVAVALAAGSLTCVLINYRRLPALRESMDAGANSSVLPVLTVGSLVGFGAVVAALPAFTAGCGRGRAVHGGGLVFLTGALD